VRQQGAPVSFDYGSPLEDRRFAARPYYDRLFGDGRIPIERSPSTSLSVKDLRAFLAQSLPEYMVPSRFELLDRLPTTPNGKLDRAALARLSGGHLERGEGYVPPRTPLEERVAAVWAEVLRLDQVGARDNFFELGGHSLNALQVVGRLGEALGMEVPIRTLFLRPT